MFYSQLVLTKKGQLGRLWFAATLGESKIPKQFAYEARIDILCRSIEQPAAPFALRLSAHLMLGVARVFSRKSSIVLSDVNNVLAAIHRHQSQVMDKPGGSKRRRSSDVSGPSGAVTLGTDTASARFDKITLPAHKTRRKSTDKGGASSGPEFLLTQEAPLDQYGRDPNWNLDNPLQINGTNLEMEFPTINLGSLLDGRSASPKPPQGSMSFQAREQDITLLPGSDLGLLSDAPPEVGLGSIDGNLSLSLSNPPGLSPQVLADPPNIAEAQQQFRDAFAGPPRQSSSPNAPVSVLDMEVMEPLPMTSPGPGQSRSPQGKSPEAIPSPTGIQKTGRKERRSSTETGTTKKSKRSLRILKYPSTDQTELPTRHIRDCLNDTSDIVIPPDISRPSRKRNKKVTQTLESMFLAYNPLSKIHGDLWQDLVVKPSLNITPSTHGSSPAQPGAPGVDLPARKIPTPPPIAKEFALPPLPDFDNFMLAESAAPPPQAVGSISGSDGRQPSGASGPSGSHASGAMSIPQSSSVASKGPEVLRDQALEGVSHAISHTSQESFAPNLLTCVLVLNQITDADRAAYDSARGISGPFDFETPTQQQATPLQGKILNRRHSTNRVQISN